MKEEFVYFLCCSNPEGKLDYVSAFFTNYDDALEAYGDFMSEPDDESDIQDMKDWFSSEDEDVGRYHPAYILRVPNGSSFFKDELVIPKYESGIPYRLSNADLGFVPHDQLGSQWERLVGHPIRRK